jgi:zinc transporter ZupT
MIRRLRAPIYKLLERKEDNMKWLRRKWKYALAIVIGYCIHLTIEGLVVNVAWYSLIKPTLTTII